MAIGTDGCCDKSTVIPNCRCPAVLVSNFVGAGLVPARRRMGNHKGCPYRTAVLFGFRFLLGVGEAKAVAADDFDIFGVGGQLADTAA